MFYVEFMVEESHELKCVTKSKYGFVLDFIAHFKYTFFKIYQIVGLFQFKRAPLIAAN